MKKTTQPTDDGRRAIVYDTDLMQPACVLLQAGMGGDPGVVTEFFDESKWLLAPTKGMKLYWIDKRQLPELARLSKKRDEQNIERKAG